ncbi:MAG: VWA domain-containing protein [Elusimicrobia bacterium]|nr:VWA domain-containing protein [Elusimicrobiota bacterium]
MNPFQKRTRIRNLLILAAAFAAAPAQAQHLIAWPIGRPAPILVPPWPRPPRPMPMPEPRPDVIGLPLGGQHLEGNVRGQVAQLWLETVFSNDTPQRLEGELFLPIPADVVIDKMEMRLGEKVMKAELLDANQARTTYENIVRQMRDPALLELQSERLLRARVYPIEPHSSVTLRFSYTQVLPLAGGLYTLRLPLANVDRKETAQSVKVNLQSETPIRLLYSPTHAVTIHKEGDKKASVEYKAAGTGGEMVVLYSLAEGRLASSLLSYREEGEDGYFMLSLSPRVRASAESGPKDIIFLVDRSGSMEDDGKILQARKALKSSINHLSPNDRFGIIDFATGVEAFSGALVSADPGNRQRAQSYVDKIEASGGTNLQGALEEAIRMLEAGKSPERIPMLLLVTDGLPTVGETQTDGLLRLVQSRNAALKTRFFCLGVGKDVNSLFLDKLAEGQHGSRDYVLPGEDIEVKLGQMVDRIAKPAFSNVQLQWSGVEASQLYPRDITDIYYGDPVVLFGRYPKEGQGQLILSGRSAGKAARVEIPVDFPKTRTQENYLPRLWAYKKIAHLLDEVRLAGGNSEIIDEIKKLARRYGIVTPYTSLLIAEDSDMAQFRRPQPSGGGDFAMEQMREDAGGASPASAVRGQAFSRALTKAKSGSLSSLIGAAQSSAIGPMASADSAGGKAAAQSPAEAAEAKAFAKSERSLPQRPQASEMRQIGSKTFYKRGDAWVDGAFEAEKGLAVEEIEFLSPRYFDLLKDHPEVRGWLSLGKNVTFVLGRKAYRISGKP